MLPESFRKRIADSAIDFALNAFWVAAFGAIGMALVLAWGAVRGLDSRFLFGIGGALVALVFVLLLTAAIVVIKRKQSGVPLRVGSKGLLDWRRAVRRAIRQLSDNIGAVTGQLETIRRVSEKCKKRLDRLGAQPGDVIEAAHRVAFQTANKLTKQAGLMVIRSEAISGNLDEITINLGHWLDWAVDNRHAGPIDGLRNTLTPFMLSIDSTLPGLKSFKESTKSIRWVSADLDVSGGTLADAMDIVIGKLSEARTFCDSSLVRLQGLTGQ